METNDNNLTLFDAIPLSHTKDPATSYIAADKFTKSGRREAHCNLIYETIKHFQGLTSAEIASQCGLGYMQVVRRVSELKTKGRIKTGAERICSIQGSRCSTYYNWNK